MHPLQNGSTTTQRVSLWMSPETNNHWAQNKAAQGGDLEAFPSSASRVYRHELSTQSFLYGRIFSENHWHPLSVDRDNTHGVLSQSRNYFDFEVTVLEDHARDFLTYYTRRETYLTVNVAVTHPANTMRCIFGERENRDDHCDEDDDLDLVEEKLWDTWTPIYKSENRYGLDECARRRSTYTVSAKIPITVIGPISSRTSVEPTPAPPANYLEPGVEAPFILSGFPSSINDLTFPPLLPTFVVEATENTTKRMLLLRTSSDLSSKYNSGNYAGILWKKKRLSKLSNELAVDEARSGDRQPYGTVDSQILLS